MKKKLQTEDLKPFTIEDLKAEWDRSEKEEECFKKKWGVLIHWFAYKLPWWLRWGIKMKIDESIQAVKFAYQRVVRGYDDRWRWGLYYESTKQTIEVLKWMREHKHGSCYITDTAKVLKTKPKYSVKDKKKYFDLNVHKRHDEALDLMIKGFEAFMEADDVHIVDKKGKYDHKATMKERARLEKIYKTGARLYIDNLRGLWD